MIKLFPEVMAMIETATDPEKPGKIIAGKTKQARRSIPTTKQMAALALINRGIKPSKAMLMAGFSKKVSLQPKITLLQRAGPQNIVATMRHEMERKGLTPKYWADKLGEWAEAKDVVVDKNGEEHAKPDYKTQIAAYDRAKDILGLNQVPQQGKVSRKIELTEFINSEIEAEDFTPQDEALPFLETSENVEDVGR